MHMSGLMMVARGVSYRSEQAFAINRTLQVAEHEKLHLTLGLIAIASISFRLSRS